MLGLRKFFGRDFIVHIGVDHGRTRGKIRSVGSCRKGRTVSSSNNIKLGSLYVAIGLALGVGFAMALVLGSQALAPLRSGPALEAQPLNTVAWFGMRPHAVLAAATTETPVEHVAPPAFTLYGTSIFASSRWALLSSANGGGPDVGQPQQASASAQWVEEGGNVGRYRLKSVNTRSVLVTSSEGAGGEWTLLLSTQGGSAVMGGLNRPNTLKDCTGVTKVPRLAMDLLNQQQMLLVQGLEPQPGGGVRVRPELAALLGGLGFMAGDVLATSDGKPLNEPNALLRMVVSPLMQGQDVKIEGRRGSSERKWRLVNEAAC